MTTVVLGFLFLGCVCVILRYRQHQLGQSLQCWFPNRRCDFFREWKGGWGTSRLYFDFEEFSEEVLKLITPGENKGSFEQVEQKRERRVCRLSGSPFFVCLFLLLVEKVGGGKGLKENNIRGKTKMEMFRRAYHPRSAHPFPF